MPDLTVGVEGAALTAATEGALPSLAVKLLPSVLIGVMLAGIFSATMSTADSQILSCSAAVTQDTFPSLGKSYNASKIATLSVAGFALVIALTASQGVFSLVLVSWSALASAFGPVLIVRLARQPLPTPLALAMMITGVVTVFVWGAYPTLADSIFKVLPGVLLPLVVYGTARLTVLRPRKA